MSSFALNVRVGLDPGTRDIIDNKEIKSIFKKTESLFLEICNIDLKFLIKDIANWDIKDIDKKNDLDFQRLRRMYRLPITIKHIDKLVELKDYHIAIYHILGINNVDILVGFVSHLPCDINGIASEGNKTCMCSLQSKLEMPIILTHEILHLFGLVNNYNDYKSIMYSGLPYTLARIPDMRDYLGLDRNSRRIAEFNIKKIISNRLV